MDIEKLEVDQFKRELDSCWYYCKKLQGTNLALYEVAVQLYEIGGIDYSKEFSNSSSSGGYSKLGLMLREEKLVRESQDWESRINYCRNILSLCSPEIKASLIRIHILEHNYADVARDYDYSRTGLRYNIDRELSQILNLDTV